MMRSPTVEKPDAERIDFQALELQRKLWPRRTLGEIVTSRPLKAAQYFSGPRVEFDPELAGAARTISPSPTAIK